ncbi:unnamed protein product [Prunus armeniaca]|uniref:MAPK kinase substrate protein n=1 Tax=Prunus armeniaca TaxID=36596 RepID=A0A6J5VKL3_PRUAR|nr:hypothetical protein GBA52_022525 [Prunus armeniaca]CAB4288582.1 unnamed protein product [Prunus armeniaca]CAB4318945.1 unnamed protein product [Prunus armeniaca]
MAEGLQRSESTFRRQGSSGLIWDDKFLQRALNQVEAEKQQEAAQQAQATESGGAAPTMERSRSNGGRGYRTVKVSPQATDPPSPKVSGCGLCGAFGKPKPSSARRPRSNKRRS